MNDLPLATRMRPKSLGEFIGQSHLTGDNKPLNRVISSGNLHSMILWGPPGVGKTTLAEILASAVGVNATKISAVLAGVKDIRAIVEKARILKDTEQKQTVLFVDEVHRFNKAQQDAFLPHVEAGTIILIGATTENPSFQINNALLSRTRVYVLKPLTDDELIQVIDQALSNKQDGLGELELIIADELKLKMVAAADGDARQVLNLLEVLSDFSDSNKITEADLNQVLQTTYRRFDQGGDAFYDQISALHKSVRGSDPDAALYWFCRMIDGGCDPAYIARRVVRMASEDIGNADPRGLELALNAWQAYERLGSPEGELVMAQAIVYLAVAAKSNASYIAYNEAMSDVKAHGSLEVPLQIRNAPTTLMKKLDYGRNYRYAHDEADAFAAGVTYLPDELAGKQYYHPVGRGLEIKIREKLTKLRELNDRPKTIKN